MASMMGICGLRRSHVPAQRRSRHCGSTAQPMNHSGCAWRKAVTAGKAWRISPIAPSRTMSTRNCFSAGDNSLFSHNETEQLGRNGWLIFEHNFEPRDVKRSKARALFRSQAHPVLFGCGEYFGAVLVAKLEELVEVGVGVGVVVAECGGRTRSRRCDCAGRRRTRPGGRWRKRRWFASVAELSGDDAESISARRGCGVAALFRGAGLLRGG